MKPKAWLTDVLTGRWLAEQTPRRTSPPGPGRPPKTRRPRRRVNDDALFNQTLEPDRAREPKEQMLAAGLPV
ncbi:MAG: hypothetical protein IPK78_20755 [Rhodospirillales bacterium]|nr:hypothetical protein [Rhodospirillales bacterium]